MTIHRWVIKGVVIGLFVFMTSGCFMTPYEYMEVPTKHVVMFNGKGKPVRPTGNLWNNGYTDYLPDEEMNTEEDDNCEGKTEGTCNKSEYSQYIDNIFSEIKKTPPEQDKSTQVNKRKILIFIHGGLNSSIDSLDTIVKELNDGSDGAKVRYELIAKEGYYPIFINWDSSLWSSYFDHMLYVRQGQRHTLWGPLTAPFVLASDVGRSIFRIPLVWGNLFRNDLQTVPSFADDPIRHYSDAVSKELLCRYSYSDDFENCVKATLAFKEAPNCWFIVPTGGAEGKRPQQGKMSQEDTFPIEVGEDDRRCLEMDLHFAVWAPTEVSTKLLLSPPLDAFGTSAWENMLRRVHLMFVSEEELKLSKVTKKARGGMDLAHLKATGYLSKFFQRMIDRASNDKDSQGKDIQWEIVLVGHSMGAIVANEIIRSFGDKLDIRDVIYLAGATSVRDYEDTAYPYLTRHFGRTRFHHFTLHPEAEAGEIVAWDLPPRGSLLVWIDNFLSSPLTLLDRTVGRYDNLLAAAHRTPTDIRKAVSIRTFSAGWAAESLNPQNHSDMAQRFKYWKSMCWEPQADLRECVLQKKK